MTETTLVQAKPWYLSKTIWLNVLAILIPILTQVEGFLGGAVTDAPTVAVATDMPQGLVSDSAALAGDTVAEDDTAATGVDVEVGVGGTTEEDVSQAPAIAAGSSLILLLVAILNLVLRFFQKQPVAFRKETTVEVPRR